MLAAFCLALFGVASAGEFEDGGAAYPRGDYATAMRFWRALADKGNALAQYFIGYVQVGQGVPNDNAQAALWCRKASDQGQADAQFLIGKMYYQGDGLPNDDAQDALSFEKAADHGQADAQFFSAICMPTAMACRRTMCRLPIGTARPLIGSNYAQYALGEMYAEGQGVSQYYVQAHMWLNLAAAHDDEVKLATVARD